MSLLKQREESESSSPFAKAFLAHTSRQSAAASPLKKVKTEVTEEDESLEERGTKRFVTINTPVVESR